MNEKPSANKDHLRIKSKHSRNSINPEIRRQASFAVCALIQEWPLFQNANIILTYLAMGSEVDLSPLLSRHPEKAWGIPRIEAGGRMVFHAYEPDKLIQHPYGMLEPDAACAVISAEIVEMILVPGLAFDLKGWRLGYGGGFYDRFLAQFKGVFAGITFHELLERQVPHDAHDIPMQFIITEKGIYPT